MSHAKILDMPVELGLEFVAIIRSHSMNAKREPLYDIVEEKAGIGLGVLLINLEGADSGRIVNGCVLKTADLPAVSGLQVQELYIHLDAEYSRPQVLFLLVYGIMYAVGGLLMPST